MAILSTEALHQPSASRRGAPGTLWSILLSSLMASLLAACCVAQEANDAPGAAETTTKPATGAIQYVGPDTYILLDAQGRPQVMPGMTYEDFMEAWKKSQQAAPHDRRPRFVIDKVAIEGKTAEGHAKLEFEATVRLLSDEPVDVPLGLVGAILHGKARIGSTVAGGDDQQSTDNQPRGGDARTEEYLDFDPGRGGFVAHLAGRTGERRTVSLDLLAPLARDGSEVTLALNCPRALSATLAMEIAEQVSQANVINGALLSRETVAGGGTRISAAGLAGPFRMIWSTAEVAAAELSTVLSASGGIQVLVDGRSVQTNARLTVRSYGGGFDRFRVRLPPGATLLQGRADASEKEPGYRITLDDEASRGGATETDPPSGRVVLVELPAKQQGPVMVELSTEQPLGLSDSDTSVKLAGFEVLGAVRQFGDVALRVADDWLARWDAGEHVRQVDTSELDAAFQPSGVTGAFQYDRQPWSLAVRVSPREIRVQATPEYKLEILADEARLRARVTYQILGARAHELRVDLRGWERTADPIEAGGVIDRDRVVTEDGVLVMPLAQTSLRRAELTFFVRRTVPRDARRLSLPLPVPVAESVATGDLVVRSGSGIELTSDLARSQGLSPTPVTTDSEPTADGASEFHFRCFQPDAVFVADRVSRSRDVTVRGAAEIELQREQAEIRQRFEYAVRFEPMTELVFDLPAELWLEDEPIEVALLSFGNDGNGGVQESETLLQLSSESVNDEATGSAEQYARVSLPQPRLGRFAVELRYVVSRPQGLSSTGSWIVPLARPTDGRVGQWRATVRTLHGLGVALDSAAEPSTWKEADSTQEDGAGGQDLHFVATRAEAKLPMAVGAADVNLPAATLVERAWLQTWLTGNMRQDRAAFRFRTGGRSVTVELPPETAADEVEVLLDGQPAETATRNAGRISVPLSPASDDTTQTDRLDTMRTHTLELRYRRVSGDRLLTRRRLTPPQLVGMKSLADVYWQIVLPGDRHVIQSPPQLAAASQWQWLGSFWGRRPTRSQAELEQWVGATTQQAPTAAQNEYLYSGLAPVSTIEVVTAPRWFIVLVSSGSVLALALAWLYVPSVRRRWLILTIACALAVLATAYPAGAMLIAQASVLGVVLAAVAALIARLATRPAQWYLPPSGGSTHRQFTPRAESVVIGPLASAVASTAPTAALPVAESET